MMNDEFFFGVWLELCAYFNPSTLILISSGEGKSPTNWAGKFVVKL